MSKSVIIRKWSDRYNKIVDHYYYPELDKTVCAERIRENRKKRYQNVILRNADKKYTSKWAKRNPKKIKSYTEESKFKKLKISSNIERAKEDFIISNIQRFETIISSYKMEWDIPFLKKSIKDINNSSIEKIFRDVVSSCRRSAKASLLNKYGRTKTEQLLKQADLKIIKSK
jgi:hypothetical protein